MRRCGVLTRVTRARAAAAGGAAAGHAENGAPHSGMQRGGLLWPQLRQEAADAWRRGCSKARLERAAGQQLVCVWRRPRRGSADTSALVCTAVASGRAARRGSGATPRCVRGAPPSVVICKQPRARTLAAVELTQRM